MMVRKLSSHTKNLILPCLEINSLVVYIVRSVVFWVADRYYISEESLVYNLKNMSIYIAIQYNDRCIFTA
jgi:hypothetical protein